MENKIFFNNRLLLFQKPSKNQLLTPKSNDTTINRCFKLFFPLNPMFQNSLFKAHTFIALRKFLEKKQIKRYNHKFKSPKKFD